VQFLIHVDKKVPNDYFTGAQRAFQSYENCTFIKRESVHWGGWGLTQAMLNGIHYIEDHDVTCDFLIYLSGQDYPLKSNEDIHNFFKNKQDKQFMEYFSLPSEGWTGR
ncbi:MAG: glycosyl transferase family 14, partial [Phototrophicales bacterium]